MIMQRTHMTQTPAQAGVGARAATRIRTAPFAAWDTFCSSVLTTPTTDAGGVLTPHRRPPIE